MPARISMASAILNAAMSEAILYGIYVVLFSIAMYLLITRDRTRSNVCLIILTVVMFLLSSTHMALVVQYTNTQYLHKDAARNEDVLQLRGDPMVYIPPLLEFLNCYLADVIVFWRAWVLWGRKTKSMLIPLFLWVASLAEGLADTHALAVKGPNETVSLAITSVTRWTIAFAATTCFSNLWAVCMIGYRYHVYRKEVIAVLGPKRASYRILLLMLIESGVLYCIFWLLFIIIYMSGSHGMYIVFHMLAQLTGIYPTMIVVLVCLRATQQDEIERFHTSIRFAHSNVRSVIGVCHGVNDDSQTPHLKGFVQEAITAERGSAVLAEDITCSAKTGHSHGCMV